jgi:hypothetical protein
MTLEGIELRVASMQPNPMKTNRTTRLVNGVFAVDAVMSAGLGLLLLGFAPRLRLLSGGGLEVGSLQLIGLLLLPWAFHNYLASRESPLSTPTFVIQATGDASWIAGSLALCVLDGARLSVWGWLLYAPQALLVCGILFWKLCTFRRSSVTALRT